MSELRKDFNKSASRLNASQIKKAEAEQAAKRARIFIGLIIFVVGISIGLFIGGDGIDTSNLTFDQASQISSGDKAYSGASDEIDFDQFWEIWEIIRERHVNQPVSETDLFYSAIRGLVAGTADPYSTYLPPEDSADFQEEINGSFEGIGTEIGIKNDKLTIIAPLSGSPAESAGLLAGDIVLYVDGIDTAYMTVNTAVDYIRGEKGTTVVLTVQRDGVEGPIDIPIVRDTIRIESAKWEMRSIGGQNIALVTITHFNGDTLQLFNEDVQELVLAQPDGIIMDLRNNPGGFLQSAVGIASAFVEEGSPIVYEEYSNGKRETLVAQGGEQLAGIPIVVLVNQGSASAAEILAGALQDYELATVVGVQTYGKGTVQELLPFDDGSSLKLTVAEWLTPDENAIDGVGIIPDYGVERTAEDYSADLDPQMDAAQLFFEDHATFESTYSAPAAQEQTEQTEQTDTEPAE